MPIKLNTASGGGVILQGANTASDYTMTMPAANGTIVYQDSNGSATIGGATSSGLLDVGPTSSGAFRVYSDNTGAYIGAYNALPLILRTNNTERARIDSSGNLLVNTTNATTGRISVMVPSSLKAIGFRRNSTTYGSDTEVGSITCDGSTTVYSTSSDYRLKENIQPMVGALATVAALKPCTYTWKDGGSAGQGFIAHELQAVVPQCVTGEKDAVDADGKPVYQGIDTSFLVATLTAAIQELKAEVDSLRAQVEAK